jgi:DNA-directed RNA polymerase
VTVKQGYLASDEVRLQPFTYSKKTVVLKLFNKEKYNIYKQIRAFMPNLIHSLDAASLALLIDLYFVSNSKNIYTVHDCFAVTANNVEYLISLLQFVYTKLYKDDIYLEGLDKAIRQHIKQHYGEQCFNEETLEINIQDQPKMKFPNINYVIGKQLPKNVFLKDDVAN